MKIAYFALAIIQIVSCSTKENETKLSGSKTYFYSDLGEIKQVRVVNAAFRDEQMVSYYIEIIERKYDLNRNVTSQVTYDINENDTLFHDYVGKIFDDKNRLIKKTDSMKMLNIIEEYQYNDEHLEISSTKFIYSNGERTNGKLTWVPIDSTLNITHHFYENEKCSYSFSFDWMADQMTLNSSYQPDTIITYNIYDLNGNKIEAITVSGVDTLYKINRKFDRKNREIEFKRVINDTIFNSTERRFDDKSNKLFEQNNSESSSHKTEFEYNESNQLVQEKWYQLK